MASEAAPRLLFVSPTFPDTQGNGLAMRAGAIVEALAQRYRVSLLVVPAFDNRSRSTEAFAREHCAEVFEVPLPSGRLKGRSGDRPLLMRLFEDAAAACVRAVGTARFDVIHAQRMYTSPIALRLAQQASSANRPRLHLDLDDIESETHARLAKLYRLRRLPEESEVEAAEARLYRSEEQRLLPQFDRVYVCSEDDAAAIRPLVKGETVVLPNAVRLPASDPGRLTTHPFRFLFVGTHGYYPNEDAVHYFCNEVLPLIRREADRPFRVRIVGRGLQESYAPLLLIPEVRLIGEVPDIATEYAEADAVIVPLRAGGGTRIKVLEAFAYRRPVVSTRIGIEGIEAEAGVDYLLGDTRVAFAEHCLALMQDEALGERIAGHAAGWVEKRNSQSSINAAVAALP